MHADDVSVTFVASKALRCPLGALELIRSDASALPPGRLLSLGRKQQHEWQASLLNQE